MFNSILDFHKQFAALISLVILAACNNTFTLFVNVSELGQGSVKVDSHLTCRINCQYPVATGIELTLTAVPETGYKFMSWSGDGHCSGSSPVCTLINHKLSEVTVGATFAEVKSVSIMVDEGGAVILSSGGVTHDPCRDVCDYDLAVNSVISLVAQGEERVNFRAWQGRCTGNDTAQCDFILKDNTEVRAAFESLQEDLRATIRWERPDSRENGNNLALYEIGGFEVRYKKTTEDTFYTVIIDDPEQLSLVVSGLESGEYQFMVAVYDTDGLTSDFSEPVYAQL